MLHFLFSIRFLYKSLSKNLQNTEATIECSHKITRRVYAFFSVTYLYCLMKKTKTKYKQINSTHTCPLQRQKMVTSAIEVAVTQKYGSSAYFCAYVCLFVVRVF